MKKIYILSFFSLVVFAASCDKIDEFLGEGNGGMANDTVPITQDVSTELSMQDVDDLIARAPAPGGDPVSADDIVDLDGDPSTPNSDFTTEFGVVGDELIIELTPPDAETEIRIDSILFVSGANLWNSNANPDALDGVFERNLGLLSGGNPVDLFISGDFEDSRFPGISFFNGIIGVRDIGVVYENLSETDDVPDMKYSFYFTLIRGGVEYGPYIIDPRMRARSGR